MAVLVGDVRVAYLNENDLERNLNLNYDDPSNEWNDNYVFLAVSNSLWPAPPIFVGGVKL